MLNSQSKQVVGGNAGRALAELDIEIIYANPSLANGRRKVRSRWADGNVEIAKARFRTFPPHDDYEVILTFLLCKLSDNSALQQHAM
jgi:hypothetical protein